MVASTLQIQALSIKREGGEGEGAKEREKERGGEERGGSGLLIFTFF